MSYITSSTTFVEKCFDLALKRDTVYGWGTYGHKCTRDYIDQKEEQYPDHYTEANKAPMYELADKGNGWMFDCNGLIKGLLWGWVGSDTDSGGAKYNANGFTDTSASGLMARCSDATTDFAHIQPGELVYKTGHIGVYVGNGLVAEATPSWDSGVQLTELDNAKWGLTGYHSRTWLKHGKLKVIDYEVKTGTLVDLKSDRVYLSLNGKVERAVKPGLVRVTQRFLNGEHQYHVMFDKRGTSRASGFCDPADLN